MDDPRLVALRARARQVLEHNASVGLQAPDFGARNEWLNVARPLSLRQDLRGKLVLLDFWSYCCINCSHVLEDLERLERKYADRAFVVVASHSAKFANEADLEHVRQAVLREGIQHPVMLDRDFATWTSYGVRAWPTQVLISPDGRVLGDVAGEGQLAVLDVLVEQALELYEAREGALDLRPLPMRLERTREIARELRFPGAVLADAASGRLYVADSGHHRVVECDLAGRFLRQFGSGEAGFEDGPALEARFRNPQGLTLVEGRLCVADTSNHALRRIDLASGTVETLVGTGRQGYERSRPLPAAGASLDSPWDLCAVDGELWIAMAGAHQIWSYDESSASIAPLAGDGSEERRDGAFELAAFCQPSGLVPHAGRVYVADSESSSVRVLDRSTRRVSTLAGGSPDAGDLLHFGDQDGAGFGRRFQHPLGIEVDRHTDPASALVYVADSYNHKIKLLDPHTGTVTTYAGRGQSGFDDGPAETARFHEPRGLSIAGSKLYVADTNNHAVRVIDLEQHVVDTLVLRDVPVPRAGLRATTLDASPLPRLATTVVHRQLKRRLAPGDATLELELALAANERLAPDAPSQYRVLREGGLVASKEVTGRIESSPVSIALGVAGPGLLRVQALYYVCDASEACHLRSHEWRVDVEERERAGRRLLLEATDDA